MYPSTMCPWTFRLGFLIPWTIHPLDVASLNDVSRPFALCDSTRKNHDINEKNLLIQWKPLNGKYILLLKVHFKFIPLSFFASRQPSVCYSEFLAVVLFIMYGNCFLVSWLSLLMCRFN